MIEMIQASFFTTTEEICNQLIKSDPVTLHNLSLLRGKVIAVECSAPALTLYLIPNADGIQIQSVYNDSPDTTLKGSLADFIQLLTAKDKTTAMFGKTIQVTGDSTLATRFQEILADARIDWEAMLGDIIGDLPAHQVALFTVWKTQWYKNTGNNLLANLNEYLKEEARLIPTRPETETFYKEVEALHERVERLAARIAAKAPSKTV
ncbi:MAG: SCP2 sterol-binding domain-containing protein [Neptuniibacter sp.]